MKNIAKHIFCLSVFCLVIAASGCKKDNARSTNSQQHIQDSIARADSLASISVIFRDSVVGTYRGYTHHVFTVGSPADANYQDTIVGADSLTVLPYLTRGVTVAGFNDQFSSYTVFDELHLEFGGMATAPQGILKAYYNGSLTYQHDDHSSIAGSNYLYFTGARVR